jgi:uncharacterized protein YdeI (YjbR/CyaY-like superfamily)
MDITKTLHVTDRKKWRAWLKKHHKTAPEIWLVYYKKATGRARIAYNDAVEEALCFGWIDSIVKSLDQDRTVQRFSPRKPGAIYSQANQERLSHLVKKGRVIQEVRESLGGLLDETFVIPPDILKAVKADRAAWTFFQRTSDSYKRIRIAYIDGARSRPAEFEKRLRNFVEMCARGRTIGFGGIEKHY